MKYLILALSLILTSCTTAKDGPIKALYLTGGCCHDYKNQQNIIPEGMAKRIDIKTNKRFIYLYLFPLFIIF